MRALIALLVACSAPPRSAPPPAPAAPQRDLAVAEPAPKKTEPDRSPVSREQMIFERRYERRQPEELDVAARDLWSPCVRDFVQAQPPDVRRALTAVLARYSASCTDDKRVVIAPPPEYRGTSYVAYRGAFGDLAFEVSICGVDEFDTATLAYDGKRWRSDPSDRVDVCAIASTPDVRTIRRMLRDALEARTMMLQADGVPDVAIGEQRKKDLRLVLDALDALNAR